MCGWFDVNKGLESMKIKNLTGYMLGNERKIHSVGTQWDRQDTNVWIAPTLSMARKLMYASQQNTQVVSPIWTTIYRVCGQDVVCTKSASGLLHTNKSSKLIVDRIVCHEVPYEMLEQMDNNIINKIKRESRGNKR